MQRFRLAPGLPRIGEVICHIAFAASCVKSVRLLLVHPATGRSVKRRAAVELEIRASLAISSSAVSAQEHGGAAQPHLYSSRDLGNLNSKSRMEGSAF